MELTYDVAPTLALLSVGHAIRHRVKVEYEGEQIEDLSGVSVAIRNTGTDPVEFSKAADASGTQIPVTLDFGEGARILGDPTVETTPPNLIVSVTRDPQTPHKVVANKFLLNPGQSATISVFLTDYRKTEPKVDAQIRGVTLQEQTTDGARKLVLEPLQAIILMWIALAGAIIVTYVVVHFLSRFGLVPH